MRILVTGSEGNIGQYLVKDLRRWHPEAMIYGTDLSSQGSSGLFFAGDLTDESFVRQLFAWVQPTHVIHTAARLYGVAGFNSDVFGILGNDIPALINVLKHCVDIEKVVYFSSSMVYERCMTPPFTEEMADTCPPPASSYGLTKFIGEKAVKFLHQQHRVPYTIWRPFNIVSPLEKHNRVGGHVFVDFFRKIFIERQESISVYGNGQQVRCFTWVEDATSMIAGLLTASETNGATFNIGSDEPTTMEELLKLMVELGKEMGALPQDYAAKVVFGPDFGVDVQRRSPALDKIRQYGWKATSRKDCFRKFLEAKLNA